MDTAQLKCDAARMLGPGEGGTGIYVHALNADGKWINADIVELDRASFIEWCERAGWRSVALAVFRHARDE